MEQSHTSLPKALNLPAHQKCGCHLPHRAEVRQRAGRGFGELTGGLVVMGPRSLMVVFSLASPSGLRSTAAPFFHHSTFFSRLEGMTFAPFDRIAKPSSASRKASRTATSCAVLPHQSVRCQQPDCRTRAATGCHDSYHCAQPNLVAPVRAREKWCASTSRARETWSSKTSIERFRPFMSVG